MATDIITMHSRYLYRKSNVLKAKIEHIIHLIHREGNQTP